MNFKGKVKGDLILFVVVVIIGAAFFLYTSRSNKPDQTIVGSEAVFVEIEGQVVHKFDLAQDLAPFKIETEHGYNVLEIKDGRVRITEADCPDKICVHTGWRRQAGQLIVCMPHYLVVKIVGDEAGLEDVDSFTY